MVEDYIRPPKCKICKRPLTYLDRWQMEKNKKTVCRCGGAPYPHREGSVVWCMHHPTGPTEEDYE